MEKNMFQSGSKGGLIDGNIGLFVCHTFSTITKKVATIVQEVATTTKEVNTITQEVATSTKEWMDWTLFYLESMSTKSTLQLVIWERTPPYQRYKTVMFLKPSL